MSNDGFTHFDDEGAARMVAVGHKPETERKAIAEGFLITSNACLERIRNRDLEKGDALQVARIAGIQAAKATSQWIPLCHPVPITGIALDLTCLDANQDGGPRIRIQARVTTLARTGVEMEALSAVSGTALCLYDMIKAVDRNAEITHIRLLHKSGGKSGVYERDATQATSLKT